MIPLSYNLRNLRVRKATTAAAAFGLGLVVFVFASAMMLSEGIKRTLGRSAGTDVAIVLRKGADAEMQSSIEDNQVGVVLASKEVARSSDGKPLGVGEMLAVILLEKLGTDGFANVTVRGVTEDSVPFRPSTKLVEGRMPGPGTEEAMVGKSIRGRFKGLEMGESFELRKNRAVTVVGVFEDGGSSHESEVWVDRDVVRAAFGTEGLVSAVRVRLTSPQAYDAFRAGVEDNRQLGLAVMRESTYWEKASELTSQFITVMGVIISVCFSFGAMIGAMITMHASIAHRQREVGTLRALGFGRAQILVSFLLESVLLALVGGIAGVAAALAMGLVRFSTMNMVTWSEIVFTFDPTVPILGLSLLVAVIMGVVGGFLPAVRAARMSPIEAMRG
jgi:putative ABC transport system permease protein